MSTILFVAAVGYLLIFAACVLIAKKYTKVLDQAAREWQQEIALPMQELHEYVCVPIIPMLDEPIHTDEHPRCSDFTCPCWADLHDQEAAFERTFIEVGMTQRFDTLPWRGISLS